MILIRTKAFIYICTVLYVFTKLICIFWLNDFAKGKGISLYSPEIQDQTYIQLETKISVIDRVCARVDI